MDEPSLIRRAAAGDQAAFEMLVSRHAAGILGVARARTRDAALADEIAQDTFVRLFAEDPTTLVDLSDEERRRRYDEFIAWMRSIDDDIVHLGGSELDTASGGIVSAADRAPSQPLVLSGFIVVRSTSYDDVARHAERCPIVGRGGQVVVRQLR